METVAVRKIKRPDGTALWRGYVVANDEFGTWIFTPRNSTIESTKDGKTETKTWPENDVLALMPTDDWYMAVWWTGGEHDITVDISKPPMFINKEWKWIDLETDLIRTVTGDVLVEDEDEFEEACEAGHISADERDAAIKMTESMESNLRHRIEPFGLVGRQHFDDAVARALPALV